ncbi:hypothetical protein lerEdw1_010944, partial [Lerista edwardsae]
NIGNIMERCKKDSFENPVAFPAALKWKIHDFCDINPFLEGIMNQFKDSLVSGLQLREAAAQEIRTSFWRETAALSQIMHIRAPQAKGLDMALQTGTEPGISSRGNLITRSLEVLRRDRENILVCKAENEKESQDSLDVGSILDRCQKESFEIPVVFPAALKWRVYEFSDINPYLEAIMKQFQADGYGFGVQDIGFVQVQVISIPGKSEAGKTRNLLWHEAKDQISYSLESLRKERENILFHKAENERESQDLLNIGIIMERCKKENFENPVAFPAALKWKIHDFRDINPCLEALMKQFQGKNNGYGDITLVVTWVKNLWCLELSFKKDQISRSLEILRKERESMLLYKTENENESQDLLNIRNILERCERKSFENSVAFPVALKWKIHDFCDINPFLDFLMKRFKGQDEWLQGFGSGDYMDTLASGLQLQEGTVSGLIGKVVGKRDQFHGNINFVFL